MVAVPHLSADHGLRLSAFLPRRLRPLMRRVRQCRRRVLGGADDDALHDLRVGLRRLRSVLRAVRKAYGAHPVRVLARRLKAIAERTNPLRDAEVLELRLALFEPTEPSREAFHTWLNAQRAEAAALRAAVCRELEGPELEQTLRVLRALLTLPIRPRHDLAAGEAAARALDAIRAALLKRAADPEALLADPAALHRVRIEAKRLRYLGEFFAPTLDRSARRLIRAAHTIQRVLGDVHDWDMLLARVADDAALPPLVRTELLVWLTAQRARQVESIRQPFARALRALHERPHPASRPPVPAPAG